MPISQLKTDSQIKCLILCLISKTTTKKQAAEEVSALYDVQGTQRKSDTIKWLCKNLPVFVVNAALVDAEDTKTK